MLQRLGFRNFAYDWRAEHVPTFDAEIEALKQHNINLVAWWFPTEAGDPRRQLGVDQARAARARGWCAHRLNVVSLTSTARPVRPSATASRAVCASSQVAAVRTPSGRSATMAVRTGSSPSAPP